MLVRAPPLSSKVTPVAGGVPVVPASSTEPACNVAPVDGTTTEVASGLLTTCTVIGALCPMPPLVSCATLRKV